MKNRPSIAVICDSIDYTLGGSSVSAKRFINSLKTNFKIYLYTNSIKHPNSNFFKGLFVIQIKDINILKTTNYVFGKVSHKKLIADFKRYNIKLVYSVYPTTFSGNAAAKAAKKLKIPVIGHFHVQAENISPIFNLLSLDSFFYKLFATFYKKCNLVFCPSIFAKNLLQSSGVKTKTAVLSNGVDLTKFKVNKNLEFNKKIYKKLNINNNTFIFLYLGRLEKEKDIFTLLKAYKKLLNFKNNKDSILIIAGNGSLRTKLQEYIKNNNLGGKVFLYGYVKNVDIVNLYNLANCYVSPSLIELEGMTVLEAMACGLPVILSDSKKSASKYFVDKNGYLFKAKNYKDLSKKLSLMLNTNLNKIKFFSTNSLKISNNYSFKISVKKMEKYFKKYLIN